jgi:uncharacterized membrane protein
MKKLLFKLGELTDTFWFIPVIIIMMSVLLSIGLVYIDELVSFEHDDVLSRFFFVNSPDSARAILSTISGAMMGVAGTVFSITLVALTLASSQFGPRLIKNFMYVRLNQVVLGSYISTYLYCLLVLNAIRDVENHTFIPSISILVAIIFAMINIILLIVFIHQIAMSIQADKVISDISSFIAKQVEKLFPEKMGMEIDDEDDIDLTAAIFEYKIHFSIKSPKNGYFQYVDGEGLMEIISECDSLFKLNHRPGSHLVEGAELGFMYSNKNWGQNDLKKLQSQFIIGDTKTSKQDLEFSINQMVEIASRALSTGMNDPFTAITCIDNLTSTMCFLAQAEFPSKYRHDDNGNLRIISDVMVFEGVLDAAFNQIRQFSKDSPSVMIKLMEALITIHGFTVKRSHQKAVVRHAEMVLRQGKESIMEQHDLDDLTDRAKQIIML